MLILALKSKGNENKITFLLKTAITRTIKEECIQLQPLATEGWATKIITDMNEGFDTLNFPYLR